MKKMNCEFIQLSGGDKPFPVEETKFGLLVIDKRELIDLDKTETKVLLFIGFQEKPTCEDIIQLRTIIMTDAKYGLADVMEYCGIYEAPTKYIEEILLDLKNE